MGLSVIDRLRVLDTEIVEISSPAVGQPATRTLLTIEVDDAPTAHALADEVADGPWYVDFNNGERSYDPTHIDGSLGSSDPLDSGTTASADLSQNVRPGLPSSVSPIAG